MALILEKTDQLEFHTDMGRIITPIKEVVGDLHWIITDLEYIILDAEEKGPIQELNQEDEINYFTGSELLEILENRKIQFIWGVFCGTKNRITGLSTEQIPYADQNSEIWTDPDKFLLQDSEIEIICFESSSTIIRFKDPELGQLWKQEFTDLKKLT